VGQAAKGAHLKGRGLDPPKVLCTHRNPKAHAHGRIRLQAGELQRRLIADAQAAANAAGKAAEATAKAVKDAVGSKDAAGGAVKDKGMAGGGHGAGGGSGPSQSVWTPQQLQLMQSPAVAGAARIAGAEWNAAPGSPPRTGAGTGVGVGAASGFHPNDMAAALVAAAHAPPVAHALLLPCPPSD
jgi:hypothetical protein